MSEGLHTGIALPLKIEPPMTALGGVVLRLKGPSKIRVNPMVYRLLMLDLVCPPMLGEFTATIARARQPGAAQQGARWGGGGGLMYRVALMAGAISLRSSIVTTTLGGFVRSAKAVYLCDRVR